ncbi:hypothetical protein ACJBSP_11850 [Streptococcus suis]
MSLKNIIFGSYEKIFVSQVGREKTTISIKGGLLLNLFALVGLVGLICWLIGLFTEKGVKGIAINFKNGSC